MSVYLGNAGGIEIRRQGEPIRCTLQAADVDVAERRFSIDFDPDYDNPRPTPLITGDQVELSKVDGSNLELVDGVTDTDVTRWVHVDMMGGIRLYLTYDAAVNGGIDEAIDLIEPAADQVITVDVANLRQGCVAQIRSWEITTQRETVNTDILGEEYRQFYDQGMISGQGQLQAIWDYRFDPCVDSFSSTAELPNYFSQLVIRFREGSRFNGTFFIYADGNDAVWYEADCICTSVALNFAAGQVIESTVQFVTTGQVAIKQGQPPGYLLQEDDDEIRLEEGDGSIELEFSL